MKNKQEQDFYHYLIEQKHAESTIDGHVNDLKRFAAWAKTESLDLTGLNYKELLTYVQHEKSKGIAISTVNARISSVSKYYEYLKEAGIREANPAKKLRIKGQVKTVIKNQFSYSQLEYLYKEYSKPMQYREKKLKLTHQRNIVMLGLMIEQGMHSGELQKMEISHINLSEGTVYAPGTSRSNGRALKLAPYQIIPLHTYLSTTREQLKPKAEELFTGRMHDIVDKQIVPVLKAILPELNNALDIRASVIIQWLKMHNIRQVQYMAGHKYIGSTERYKQQDIETLQDQLSKHHPFG